MPNTGSYAARQPPAEQGEDPVTVLVTGFGPFLAKYPRNSSWEIASTLPALLPGTPSHPTPIHLHIHPTPIRVSYNNVSSLVPSLLPPNSPLRPSPDIILHIGLAAGRKFFTLEQGAHKCGFERIPDVDGERWADARAESKFPSNTYPSVLRTSFDTSDVLARWKSNLSETPSGSADVRLNPDAGNFLCGFIYYNSLAHYYGIKHDERPVAFMHVPDLSHDEAKMREGWDVAVALIRALVESRRCVGVVDGVGSGAVSGSGNGEGAGMDNNFV